MISTLVNEVVVVVVSAAYATDFCQLLMVLHLNVIDLKFCFYLISLIELANIKPVYKELNLFHL